MAPNHTQLFCTFIHAPDLNSQQQNITTCSVWKGSAPVDMAGNLWQSAVSGQNCVRSTPRMRRLVKVIFNMAAGLRDHGNICVEYTLRCTTLLLGNYCGDQVGQSGIEKNKASSQFYPLERLVSKRTRNSVRPVKYLLDWMVFVSYLNSIRHRYRIV